MAFHWWVWQAKEGCCVSGTRAAFQKWQSEFAPGVELIRKAALLWLAWSFWVLPCDFGVPEAGWRLREGT